MGDLVGTLTPFTAAKGLCISEEIVLRVALDLGNGNDKDVNRCLRYRSFLEGFQPSGHIQKS